MNTIEWGTGLDNFRKCKHDPEAKLFEVELLEGEFEPNRDLDIILKDNLQRLNAGTIEILYSGGMDSEFIINVCRKYGIQHEVITMMIYADDLLINTHDVYYADKYLRQNNIPHRYVKFDALEFFESGEYLSDLVPLQITEPNVASHFWLINQCNNFPVLGGDWNWFQSRTNVLSPSRISYNSYERYLDSKNMQGVGNMLSHSFEAAYRLIQLHVEHDKLDIHRLKGKMYNIPEIRVRSYGWEGCPKNVFNMPKYRVELLKRVGLVQHKIKWGSKVANLINSTTNENTKF